MVGGVPATAGRVDATSKKITGVRPGWRMTSSVRPGTLRPSTHCAASRTTLSIRPCFSQSGSNIGLLAGIAT